MIRIFIVDDHPLIREGVRRILARETDLEIVGEGGSIAEMWESLSLLRSDVLILDISLPDRSGLDALKDIQQLHPRLRILVLSMYPGKEFAVRVLKAGAHGFLNKEMAPEELVRAIRHIAHGHRYINDSVAEILASQVAGEVSNANPHHVLSDREYEVFMLLIEGKSVRDIAGKLLISVSTINTYRARIMEKLHVQSTTELVNYAWQIGLKK